MPLVGRQKAALYTRYARRRPATGRVKSKLFSPGISDQATSGQVQLTLRQQQSLRRLLYHCATDLQLLDQQLTMTSDNSSQLYSLDVASGHTGKQQLQRQTFQMKPTRHVIAITQRNVDVRSFMGNLPINRPYLQQSGRGREQYSVLIT